jgi:nucleoside-diphosphate-sugar epimerase
MTTAVVTGATGFLGSVLVRRLIQAGWEVAAIVRPSSDRRRLDGVDGRLGYIVDDGTDRALEAGLTRHRPELVFHLAAKGGYDHVAAELPALLDANVVFGTRVMEAMCAAGCRRLVCAGSFWQHYGNAQYSPVSLYAASKQAFEAIVQYYVEARGVAAAVLTLFDIYGPDDPRPKVFNQVLAAAKTGRALDLSSGDQLVDLVHVDDAARAFLCAAAWLSENPAPGLTRWSAGSGEHRTLREVVERFVSMHSLQAELHWGARAHRAREVMRPWDRGARVPGWRPEIGLDEGLHSMLASSVGDAPGAAGAPAMPRSRRDERDVEQ